MRDAKRAYDRSVKLPRKLVEDLSRTTTLSQHAWVESRQKKDFSLFQPWLEKIVALKREEADVLESPTGIKYDALIEDYEPGATSAQIQTVFSPLRETLVEFVAAIKDSEVQPDISILEREYPVDAQKTFGVSAATAIGFRLCCRPARYRGPPFLFGDWPGRLSPDDTIRRASFPGCLLWHAARSRSRHLRAGAE